VAHSSPQRGRGDEGSEAGSPEMRTLSVAETRRFLGAARGDRLEALYVLAVQRGIRQGELLALKLQDVDLENARTSVRRTLTKSGGRLLLGEPKTKRAAVPSTSPKPRFCVSYFTCKLGEF
jgi:integrase